MDGISLSVVAATTIVAFANGANDNFKGVATLYGSGRSSYVKALSWATVTTLAGSFLALLLGAALAAKFTGKGLVPDALATTPRFALAVGGSAAATVLLATRLGFPISTTHALIGALLGAGTATVPADVRFTALAKIFVLPLVASPVAALVLTALVYLVASRLRRRAGLAAESCVCVASAEPAAPRPSFESASTIAAVPVVVASKAGCGERGEVTGVTARQALDLGHFLSAGAVGFARGLNDSPKIMAIAATVPALSRGGALTLVSVTMAIGGLVGARRVAEKISRGVTTMNEGQSFAANLVTALLVCAATFVALPVSTTHVSVGALFGIGATSGAARRSAIIAILLAWLVTLPVAFALAAGAAWLLC